MGTFTQSDTNMLASSVAVRVHWPSAAAGSPSAPEALDKLWQVAADQGWFELAAYEELAAEMAITRELGRLACPFPLIDGYLAVQLSGAIPTLQRAIVEESVRVVAGVADRPANSSGGRTVRFVEAASAVTHVLPLAADDPYGSHPSGATLHPVLEYPPAPGIAVPSWSEVEIDAAEYVLACDRHELASARAVLQVGLAARAAAAAQRAHELAIEHATTRVQIGRLIGAFGAEQQRVASAQIDMSAAQGLLEMAIGSVGTDELPLAAAMAVGHVRHSAPRVQLAAQHTLAASEYFEDPEAPWPFRRVHAGASRSQLFQRPGEACGDLMVETTRGLPSVTSEEDLAATSLRSELTQLFGDYAEAARRDPEAAFYQLRLSMIERGLRWSVEHGGRQASVAEQVVLNDEIQYHRVPVRSEMATVMLLGDAITRHGIPCPNASSCGSSAAARSASASVTPNPRSARISPPWRLGPSGTARTGSSPGKKRGRATPKWPHISGWPCGQIRPPTHAKPASPSFWSR